MSFDFRPEIKPCVRVTATYPATDGSMPETVEVTWETEFPSLDMISRIIDTMCHATWTKMSRPAGSRIVVRDNQGNEIH